ncbi:MAG TPA: molecular chaperone HtpG [Opitutaceae bacterium]|nr:molecular chaperone HtpG [Opitutaceae bacterium]
MSAPAEKHVFQAEVKQLLDLVIHSLYTDREIFIRELVSNASDALEKLRHLKLVEKDIFDADLPLEVNITTDDKAGTITFQDHGIGMSRTELVENLGTIAHSGTKAFLNSLKEKGDNTNASLIGQFGVGFYSAFMPAKEVKVYTHSWRPTDEHLVWTSDGTGAYEIETTADQKRGCKIVITLKDDQKQFAQASEVKRILEHYSAFVTFPVNLNGEKINKVEALWLRAKSAIKDEEYTEFYKFQAKAFDEPRFRLHFNADAPLTINSLLFTPKENQERFGFGRMEAGVSLYCKNVLIDAKPEGLLPEWLRFLKGVVDSADLPLNISRESMQDSALVQKLNRVITKRYLKFLEEEAEKNADAYADFYKQFGIFLKEGVTSDFTHREQLAKLLRYESSLTEKGKTTTLAEYVKRMPEAQKEIYFLHALNRAALESGPYLEAFKSRNFEVLFVYEPIDEFVMSHLSTFEGKRLVSADSADLDLGDAPAATGEALPEADVNALSSWLKEKLGDAKVGKVEAGKRLVDSPVVALNSDKFLSPAMRRIMRAMKQEEAEQPPKMDLEINPRHPLIKSLHKLSTTDADRAALIAEQLYENALLAAGIVEEPRNFVTRLNKILEMAAK